jgi:hypothetical protein
MWKGNSRGSPTWTAGPAGCRPGRNAAHPRDNEVRARSGRRRAPRRWRARRRSVEEGGGEEGRQQEGRDNKAAARNGASASATVKRTAVKKGAALDKQSPASAEAHPLAADHASIETSDDGLTRPELRHAVAQGRMVPTVRSRLPATHLEADGPAPRCTLWLGI